jgi:hypothetical protein
MRLTREEFLAKLCEQPDVFPETTLRLTPKALADVLVLAGVLQQDPPRYYPRDLAVGCPKCEAPPGEECRTRPGKSGTWLPGPHEARQIAGAEWAGTKAAEKT